MSDTTIPEQDPRDARIAELEAELARVRPPRELREHAKRVKQDNAELRLLVDREREARTQVVAERAAEAERIGDLVAELMFTKAGVDTDDSDGACFARIYDGPIEVDAIQTAYAIHHLNARRAAARFADHLTRTATNGANEHA